MSLYSLALFLHVVGALLLFVTLTVEGVALRLLRRAVPLAAIVQSQRINRGPKQGSPATSPD